jgi:predicted nucleotidyltransferase
VSPLPRLTARALRFRDSLRFEPSRSDLDFLVEFEDLGHGYFDAYFGLLESLEALFDKPIDLVMSHAIRNPYFLEGIRDSRTLLYAA